jgi:hypothetical protein
VNVVMARLIPIFAHRYAGLIGVAMLLAGWRIGRSIQLGDIAPLNDKERHA